MTASHEFSSDATGLAQMPVNLLQRDEPLYLAGVLLLFSVLVIDGFPPGSAALREFGARPANFILALMMVGLLANQFLSGARLTLSRREVFIALVALLGIPSVNLPVALMLQADTPTGSLVVDWCKQYAMMLWGLVSFMIWRRIMMGLPDERFAVLICVGAILPLIGFYGDLAGSSVIQELLGLVRLKQFSRPSGLATEPAVYASWIAFVWPFMLFLGLHAGRVPARVLGLVTFVAICLSAYLCHARTIAVIVLLQLAYYGVWATRRNSGLLRFRALVIVSVFLALTVGVFAASLTSLGDADIGSNISRIGSTVAAVRVSLAYPWFGVGIGQLKYFFGAFAPDFALAIEEIQNYATGISDYRASAFNLFVRLVCEFGFATGMVFSFLVVRPILKAVALRDADLIVVYATLAAIGGVGYWLMQDHYGYQPGIASLAILSNLLSARARAGAGGNPPAARGRGG